MKSVHYYEVKVSAPSMRTELAVKIGVPEIPL